MEGRINFNDLKFPDLPVIKFTVKGVPKSKLRARVFTHTVVKNHKLKTWTSTKTPDDTRVFEHKVKEVALKARYQYYPEPLKNYVCVDVVSYMPINTKSNTEKVRRLTGLKRPGKPDADNLLKSVLDAMNTKMGTIGKEKFIVNEGVYLDDLQVISASVTKLYSEKPRTEVTVKPLPIFEGIDIYRYNKAWWFGYKDKKDTKRTLICPVDSKQGNVISSLLQQGVLK